MRVLVFIGLIALPLSVVADNEADESMRLRVKPVLCITDARTPQCDMSFLVVWQSATNGYYCLFNDFADAPVRCWNETREGETSVTRLVRANFSYWMTGSDLAERLAQVEVEVLRMDSDDRRRNRRTRHVWDIN